MAMNTSDSKGVELFLSEFVDHEILWSNIHAFTLQPLIP